MKKPTDKKPRAKRAKRSTRADADPPPLDMDGIRAAMERAMAGMGRNLAPHERTPLEDAQGLIYEAWDAPSRKRKVELARKALAISRDCADAYVILAENEAKNTEEALELFREGVKAGERALGRKFFTENAGDFWMILESRPYMRARTHLAMLLWELDDRLEAIEHLQDLLRLNTNDNQGLRYLLLPRLIELGRDVEAERLFQTCADDDSAMWLYSRALLDFRQSGASPKANAALDAALAANPHVPDFIFGRREVPDDSPDTYSLGDESEALLYAEESEGLWRFTPGAMEWMKERVGAA